jgi:signal transduction histidine kinase/putative methionine-R-sulfoxide reductase with GAF domain
MLQSWITQPSTGPKSGGPILGDAVGPQIRSNLWFLRRRSAPGLFAFTSVAAPTNLPLYEILTRLNEIGAAINRQDFNDPGSLESSLRLIVESAAAVASGSTALIYTFDEARATFDPRSGVSFGPLSGAGQADWPRPDGMGMRAVATRKRVLSYEAEGTSIHPAKQALGAQAVVCYPLATAEGVLGALYVYLHERPTFTQIELLMLDNFVNLAAMTLAAARRATQAQQDQLRKDQELRHLRRAGRMLSSRSSLKGTLDVILRMALEMTDARYGIFRLVDKSGKLLVAHAIAGEGLEKPATENLPINERSVMGLVAIRREPLVISDLSQEPWNSIYYPLDRDLVMRSEVTVPLIGASGRLEGVLNLESPQINAFSKQDRYILQIMATQAVAAIQEIRLLDALLEISTRMLTQPLQQVHQSLVDKACDLLNVPIALLWLLEGSDLVLQASSRPKLNGAQIRLDKSPTGKAILDRRPVIAPEDRMADRDWCAPLAQDEVESALIVPLFASEPQTTNDSAIGAISVYSGPDEGRDFSQSEWDRKVLNILGHYAVLALQSSARQEALRNAQEQRAVTETFAAIGDIASNLLHRLNNKIGTIPVRLEGIQDKSHASLEADDYLAANLTEIDHSAREALDVMQETLYHLQPIQLAPVSIPASVEEAMMTTRLPEGIQIQYQGLDDLPMVQAGAQRLTLVFVNLLENASDAMQGNGIIQITGRVLEQWIEIQISDSGPGIPPELHERIFEFNYSSRAKDTPGKLGFGLWWVKTLMARFGGSVQVESDGHSGTRFILRLPHDEAGS